MPDPEISAILQALERFRGRYEREAVDSAIAHREEITPYLIESLEKLAANPAVLEDEEYYLYIYAVFLLGHFQEIRAHGAIVEVFGLSDGAAYELFGDIITENLPIILFNTCGGNFDLIKSLILNRQADEYARGSAARALVFAVAAGLLPREEAMTFFSTVFTGEEAEPDSAFWGLITDCVLDLQPQELMPLIEEADARGLLDGSFLVDEDFSRALNQSIDQCLEDVRREMQRDSLDDLHRQMSWWASFKNEEEFPFVPFTDSTTKKSKKEKKQKKKKKMAKASRRKNRG